MYFTEATTSLLASLKRNFPQSLLLTGEKGVALSRAVEELANDHESIYITPDASKANPTISVETIRGLYSQTKSKYTKRRIVIIQQADTMSASAQAAFLKLLEEPGVNVHFILVTHNPEQLLPTIRSRTQAHTIEPLDEVQTRAFITAKGVTDPRKTTQLLYLANGYPEELEKLIDDDAYFTTAAGYIKDAQLLLGSQPYDKLLIAHRYKDDRAGAMRLIDSALLLTQKSLLQTTDYTAVEQLEQLMNLRSALEANQNIRLAFARFVV